MADGSIVIDTKILDDGFKKGLGRLQSGSVRFMKRTAAAIGVATVAAFGYTIKKGLDRALDIEDAKATLKSLGNSVKKVEAITEDTLKAVRGTPFALNDAMKAAASALASGIKPGKDLTRTLALMGDAATVAKIPFGDMAQIFNKVEATGKVTGEILQQMGERGIPILQWLAKEYGVTADKMRDMVSRGQVDSKMMKKAIKTNIGGAAQDAGETTRGALANLNAAIGRAGESMVEGLLGPLREMFGEVTKVLDDLGPVFKMIGGGFADLIKGFGGGDAVAAGFSILAGKIANGLAAVLPALVSGVTAIIIALAKALPTILPPLVDAFIIGIKALADALPAVLPALTQAFADIIIVLGNEFGKLAPILIPVIVDVINQMIDVLIANEDLMVEAAINLTLGILSGIRQSLPAIVKAMWNLAVTLLTSFAKFLGIKSPSTKFAAMGKDIVRGLINGIGAFIGRAVAKVRELAGRLIGPIRDKIGEWKSAGGEMVSGIWSGITNKTAWLISQIRSFASNVTLALKRFFKIKSPSKLFEKEIGVNLALGIGKGFERTMSATSARMAAAVSGEMGRFQTVSGAGASSTVINFNRPVRTYSEVVRAQRDIERGLAW